MLTQEVLTECGEDPRSINEGSSCMVGLKVWRSIVTNTKFEPVI